MPRVKKNRDKKTGNGANLGFEEKLWAAADKMRGHMDPAEYKHVALGLIFLKYISDAFEERRDHLAGWTADPSSEYFVKDPEERYVVLEERDEYRSESIFWVPKAARWSHLQAKAKQPTIGKLIDDAMVAIEKDNPSLKGVLPKEYARQSLDKQRLGELIDLIGSISFQPSPRPDGHPSPSGRGDGGEGRTDRSLDILGRVYEYFLSKFASAEGKKGGEFYTPRCVVKLLVEMIEPYQGRVYDPCCGSSGMFVQSVEFIEAHASGNGNGGKAKGAISIYGQESNSTTWRLAKMNLAIRGIEANLGPNNADTFHNDLHKDLKANFILANPPFNMSDWGGERLRNDVRWKYGVPPVSNANFAWVQHFIHHLSPSGVAGFVLAQVSLSSESSVESEIRKGIINDDLVDCVVTLPGKLFYTTPIPACLWFITRNKSASKYRDRRGEVLFIDTSSLGTPESRTHSYLKDEDIAKIASIYHLWRSPNGGYQDVRGLCRSVSVDEIHKAGHSLFPAKYIGIDRLGIGSGDKEISVQIVGKVVRHQEACKRLLETMANVSKSIASIIKEEKIQPPHSYSKMCLSSLLERTDERLGDRPEPEILTCTERAGLILQKERFAKRVATEDTTKYKVVHKTDIVYNPYLLWAGAIDQCWIVDFGITSPAYEVLKIREGFDPTLVGALLKSPRLMKMYDGISVGTVQRRRRAPVEKFLELEIVIPSKKDHQKFSYVAAAIQSELALLRGTSKNATDIINDLCKFWLGTNRQ